MHWLYAESCQLSGPRASRLSADSADSTVTARTATSATPQAAREKADQDEDDQSDQCWPRSILQQFPAPDPQALPPAGGTVPHH